MNLRYRELGCEHDIYSALTMRTKTYTGKTLREWKAFVLCKRPCFRHHVSITPRGKILHSPAYLTAECILSSGMYGPGLSEIVFRHVPNNEDDRKQEHASLLERDPC